MKAFEELSLRKLDRLLGGDGPACVIVHSNPDGDALGSGMAMVRYLRTCRSREAFLLLPDPYPDTLAFVVDRDLVIDVRTAPERVAEVVGGSSLVICQDFNTLSRAGGLSGLVEASSAEKILIDHHPHPDVEGFSLIFSETEVSSASELLYSLLVSLPGAGSPSELPLGVATPLMVGMTTDTNNFANSVFPSTLRMASELLAAGVDRDGILLHLYNEYRENRFRAMGYCLSELLTITPDGLAYMIIDRSAAERFDIREGETEGFVNMPLGISSVRVSVLLREDEGYFRVSVRSKPGTSAREFASTFFHGGGHECASGGRLFFPGDIDGPSGAENYVRTVAARFMREEKPVE